MEGKIRCFDEARNKVIWLSPSVAYNEGHMKKYRIRIEHLEPIPEPKPIEENKVTEAAPIETAPKRKTKPKQNGD